ncbi:MAG: hypothetical protein U5K69_13715 [Balneolaceae bacterium]|nr:hypothetical protein [Balneolaceae bacterium]
MDLLLVDFTFGGPESIPSGWTTLRMHNKGSETHEFVLHRLPDSISYNDMHRQVIQPMDSLEQLLHDGKIDSARRQKALPASIS